jgi:hypothetical protein
VTVAAVKVIEKASPFPRGPTEVNREHSSARFQNPSHLARALLASFGRQVMQHDRSGYDIELTVGKRQRLGQCSLQDNLDARLPGLLARPGDHFWRRIDSAHGASGPGAAFGCDGKSSRPAAHIQHGLARFEVRQPEHSLAKVPLPPSRS